MKDPGKPCINQSVAAFPTANFLAKTTAPVRKRFRFLLGTPRINLLDASGLVSSNLVTSKLVHDEKSSRLFLSVAQMEQKIDLSAN
jgi:hypothetical protein